jgi:uncharacterized protein YbjQ (UPF0145 family)
MNDVPGYRVTKVLGAVYGLTVRSRNWAAGLGDGDQEYCGRGVAVVHGYGKTPFSGFVGVRRE